MPFFKLRPNSAAIMKTNESNKRATERERERKRGKLREIDYSY